MSSNKKKLLKYFIVLVAILTFYSITEVIVKKVKLKRLITW